MMDTQMAKNMQTPNVANVKATSFMLVYRLGQLDYSNRSFGLP